MFLAFDCSIIGAVLPGTAGTGEGGFLTGPDDCHAFVLITKSGDAAFEYATFRTVDEADCGEIVLEGFGVEAERGKGEGGEEVTTEHLGDIIACRILIAVGDKIRLKEIPMTPCSRRKFLHGAVTAGALAVSGFRPVFAAGGKATDWVTLGKSNVNVTRLAFGTGT